MLAEESPGVFLWLPKEWLVGDKMPRKGDRGHPNPARLPFSHLVSENKDSPRSGCWLPVQKSRMYLQTWQSRCAGALGTGYRKCCAFSRLRNRFGDVHGFHLSCDNMWPLVV